MPDKVFVFLFANVSIKIILDNNLLSIDGIIVIETDEEERELQKIKEINNIEIINLRTYGRVKLIFLKIKERG